MGNVSPLRPDDGRYVYGAGCTWNDNISKVATRQGIPCCPHCGSVLFEMDSEEKWWTGAQRYEDAGHPGYVAMMRWAKGKCFRGMPALIAAYEARSDG